VIIYTTVYKKCTTEAWMGAEILFNFNCCDFGLIRIISSDLKSFIKKTVLDLSLTIIANG
jgi:hypothetical protein